MQEIKPRTTTY